MDAYTSTYHTPFPLMHGVQDQNLHKITITAGSTGHIPVTTPWIYYLDDILVMSSFPVQLKEHTHECSYGCCRTWVILNLARPTQMIEFLGFLVDSKSVSISLPQDKIAKVQKQCRRMLSRRSASARELAKLVGLLTSQNTAVLPVLQTTLLNRSGLYDFWQTLTRGSTICH